GIEYADMQVIGEAYQLLRYGAGMEPAEIAAVFQEWNSGDLDSYLIEITAEVLGTTDPDTGKPLSMSSSTPPVKKAPAVGPPLAAWTLASRLPLSPKLSLHVPCPLPPI